METKRRKYGFCLWGHLPTKANSRRIVTNKKTGKPFSIKSEDANTWTTDCILACREIMQGKTPLVGQLAMRVHVYYRSNRSDLSVELLMDGLQKGGIYLNDRQIIYQELFKQIDPENPRTEIAVWELEEPQIKAQGSKKKVSKKKDLTDGIPLLDNLHSRGATSRNL
jgi:Holliday junction resolvase RusA-like endonuclease